MTKYDGWSTEVIAEKSAALRLGIQAEELKEQNKNYLELIKWLIVRSPPHGRTSKIHEYVKDHLDQHDAVAQAIKDIEESLKEVKNGI